MEMRAKISAFVVVAFLIFSVSAQLYTIRAEYEDSESYIAVELLSLDVIDDLDDGKPGDQEGLGELELATFVYAEGVKEQSTVWPRKDQGASWQEVNTEPTNDRIEVNMPIFIAKEDQIGDEMAIIIAAVENDETADWVEKVMDAFFKIGPEVAKLFKAPGWVTTSLKASETVTKILDQMLPDSEKYGVYTKILLESDWEDQIQSDSIIYERARPIQIQTPTGPKTRAEFYVRYKVRRIEVPARTPPLAVKLKSITASDWVSWDDTDLGGDRGEVFINTRAFNDVTIDAALVQMTEFGTMETPGGGTSILFPETFDLYPGDTWTPPSEFSDGFSCSDIIYITDAVGLFLHLEITAWDKDGATNHDIVGRYSRTFWPDENWAIGQTITASLSEDERGRRLSSGEVTIEFEIIALPFSNVLLTATTSEEPREPGETITTGVYIENKGTIDDTYALWVEGLDSSWYSWDGPSTETLLRGESKWRYLSITPPRRPGTTPGRYEFKVKANSTNEYPQLSTLAASDTDTTAFRLKAFYGVEVVIPSDVSEVQAGHEAIYTIGVKNLGNVRTDFRLSINCLDFDESWVNLWPDTLWDVEPGRTGSGFLKIRVPPTWLETSVCNFEITATQANDEVEYTAPGSFGTIPPVLGEQGIAIELVQGLDYLFMENIKIRITALVKDIVTHQPITDLTVTMSIYDPSGTLWTSETMTEKSGTGIYEWQSSKTVLDMTKRGGPTLTKGIYLVHVTTSYNGGIVQDVMEFHIDPPAGGINYLYVFAVFVFVSFLTGFILRKKMNTHHTSQSNNGITAPSEHESLSC
jgi:hypothetical protein